jgi:hypothetical protein
VPHSPSIGRQPRPIARDGIAAGRLPVILPARMYAGCCLGATCRLSDQPIEWHDVEDEVMSFVDGGVLFLQLTGHAVRRMERLASRSPEESSGVLFGPYAGWSPWRT